MKSPKGSEKKRYDRKAFEQFNYRQRPNKKKEKICGYRKEKIFAVIIFAVGKCTCSYRKGN
jgi:hypothetical protein